MTWAWVHRLAAVARDAEQGATPVRPSSSPTRSSGPPHIQIDVQIAYGLRFRRSIYARKAKEITFPMALVPCPSKIGVVRNHQNTTNF
jgi:hypothetical protein